MEISTFLISMKNPYNYPIIRVLPAEKNNHHHFQKERFIISQFGTQADFLLLKVDKIMRKTKVIAIPHLNNIFMYRKKQHFPQSKMAPNYLLIRHRHGYSGKKVCTNSGPQMKTEAYLYSGDPFNFISNFPPSLPPPPSLYPLTNQLTPHVSGFSIVFGYTVL